MEGAAPVTPAGAFGESGRGGSDWAQAGAGAEGKMERVAEGDEGVDFDAEEMEVPLFARAAVGEKGPAPFEPEVRGAGFGDGQRGEKQGSHQSEGQEGEPSLPGDPHIRGYLHSHAEERERAVCLWLAGRLCRLYSENPLLLRRSPGGFAPENRGAARKRVFADNSGYSAISVAGGHGFDAVPPGI